jgi:hypothetical protein
MIDPIEQNPNNSISGSQPGGIHQTPKTEELIAQMITQVGANTAEANLLEDWSDQLAGAQGATTQGIAANPIMNTTPPGIDGTSAADNSNTGSINGSSLV